MTEMRKDAGFLSRWAPGITHVSCVIGASVALCGGSPSGRTELEVGVS
jgi:hypothetical protein